MGLTIYYSGSFNKNVSMIQFIEEVRDVAEIQNWKYHILDRDFPLNASHEENYEDLCGICFTPPGCETVDLCFSANGKMTNLLLWSYYRNNPSKEREHIYNIFPKTQYAGIEVHKLLIHLFKYLAPKYFIDFELTDEGLYWETGDEKILKEKFDRYDYIVNSVAGTFHNFPKKDSETIEEYLDRVLKEIAKNKNL